MIGLVFTIPQKMTNRVIYGSIKHEGTLQDNIGQESIISTGVLERRKVMTDRFTKPVSELEEKNSFICESCDDFYGHGHDREGKRGERRDDSKERRHGHSMTDTIVKGDPAPFGS